MSTELLILIGVLGLLDMFSPAVIGVTVYVLLVAKGQKTRLIITYLVTVALFYFSVGVFLMLGLDVFFDRIADVFRSNTAKTFMTIVGAILLVGSWFVPKKKATGPPKPKTFKVGAMVALGLTTSLIEVATALPYFAAIGILTSNKLPFYEWFPILIGYNIMMITPALILLSLHILFRHFMNKPLMNLQNLFDKNTSSALSWVMFFVGLFMLANGGEIG
ncbi:GAP family protein [Bacillus sp. JJ722]|uniref:GAP family protein n=1 Tax=Bacillus sp. JJ722 TaxID=3122973 RepID=UPI002FFF2917